LLTNNKILEGIKGNGQNDQIVYSSIPCYGRLYKVTLPSYSM